MKPPFVTLGLIGRQNIVGVCETLTTLIQFLSEKGKKLVIESETASLIEDNTLPTCPRESLGEQVDCVIIIGGDGSLLSAARTVAPSNTPILGINRGHLGFLTDIHPGELSKIAAVLEGEYDIEKRSLIVATASHKNKALGGGVALNDVILLPGAKPHMIEFEVYVDDNFVCSHRADGLIIATPTGSTAYALSSGGPILHPSLNALALVPICSHTLSARPIVIDGDSQITLKIAKENHVTPRMSCDGQDYIKVPRGGTITVQKHQHQLTLVHPTDYSYFETLRTKLHWGTKL